MSEPEGGSWQSKQDYWRRERQYPRMESGNRGTNSGCGASVLFLILAVSFTTSVISIAIHFL